MNLIEQLKQIRETDCGFDVQAQFLNEDDLVKWEKLIFPFLEKLSKILPEISQMLEEGKNDLEDWSMGSYDIGPKSIVDRMNQMVETIGRIEGTEDDK